MLVQSAISAPACTCAPVFLHDGCSVIRQFLHVNIGRVCKSRLWYYGNAILSSPTNPLPGIISRNLEWSLVFATNEQDLWRGVYDVSNAPMCNGISRTAALIAIICVLVFWGRTRCRSTCDGRYLHVFRRSTWSRRDPIPFFPLLALSLVVQK